MKSVRCLLGGPAALTMSTLLVAGLHNLCECVQRHTELSHRKGSSHPYAPQTSPSSAASKPSMSIEVTSPLRRLFTCSASCRTRLQQQAQTRCSTQVQDSGKSEEHQQGRAGRESTLLELQTTAFSLGQCINGQIVLSATVHKNCNGLFCR
jgi:hypothetical protein